MLRVGERLPAGHGRQVCNDCGSYRFYEIGVGHLSDWLIARPAGPSN